MMDKKCHFAKLPEEMHEMILRKTNGAIHSAFASTNTENHTEFNHLITEWVAHTEYTLYK